MFSIPIIKFNLQTNYKTLEGQYFQTKDGKIHHIEECYQRNAFILNENGAVIESEAGVKADSVEAIQILQHPKKIIFDTPFLIIIKKVDKQNPYLVIQIVNAELMTKQ